MRVSTAGFRFIAQLEEIDQPYLFKLKQTGCVKSWSAVQDTLKLSGWTQAQRVIVLRRALKSDLAMSRKAKATATSLLHQLGEQMELLMPDQDVQVWEYAVLVTNSAYPLATFGQL